MKYAPVLILLFFTMNLHAQENEKINDDIIVSKYGINDKEISKTAFLQPGFYDSSRTKYFLVKIDSPLQNKFVKNSKQFVKRRVAANWFIVKYDTTLIPYAHKVLEAGNQWKLSPALLQAEANPQSKRTTYYIQVKQLSEFLSFVKNHSGEVIIKQVSKDANVAAINTTYDFVINQLLPLDNILFIEQQLQQPKEETVINDYDKSVNSINLFYAMHPAINADGLTVSVKETWFDTTDIDFKSRYINSGIGSSTNSTHATTMATIIGGAGNSFYSGKGIAWGAKLTSSDYTNLLPDNNEVYQQYGISIQNNSYGVGIENFYGADAAAYDASAIANPSLLQVFSAGNSGSQTPATGQYQGITGYANLTGSFKQAKNILVVGSVDSFYNVPTLSSKGPAFDGRIKPELVAYGNDGSSGAAAITSGTALVMQSAYANAHAKELPPNTLIKAIIINSADDVYTKGPDYFSGFGNINTSRAVNDMMDAKYFSGFVAQGESKNFKISVPANAANLKITLVWNDVAAAANAFTALINDIDLHIKDPANNNYFPWVLNSLPDSTALAQLPVRKRDSLNNIEQVSIDIPPAGDYIISVNGFNISSTSQDFHIAYRWDTINHFQFISPTSADFFSSGEQNIFRWQSSYANQKARLEYSTDKGLSWNLINDTVDLSVPYLFWQTPAINSTAIARMSIGPDVYYSDTFPISGQLYPNVGFNCNDSALIYWSPLVNVQQYKISKLGDKYLETLALTTDTSFIINKSIYTEPYIAVAPFVGDNITGVNSFTFNYSTQGTGCYISNFLADLQNDEALLRLSLGTTYNASAVMFQKLTATGWTTINSSQPVNGTDVSYSDKSLSNGINTYRAVLKLNNGAQLVSNEAFVYYFKNGDFVLLPNPVRQGQKLTILSNNFIENTLVIVDVTGRKVLQQQISSSRSDINVAALSRGMYFVIVYNEKEKLFSSKLLIH